MLAFLRFNEVHPPGPTRGGQQVRGIIPLKLILPRPQKRELLPLRHRRQAQLQPAIPCEIF